MYYFYINDVLLPVTPSEISVKIKNQNKTVNLADGSEFNIVKLPGLSEISFDCLLPNVRYPFAVYENDFLNGKYFLDMFEDLKLNKSVFKLRIIRKEGFGNTVFDCTIEDYTIKESANNGFDYTVSLKLKQYIYNKTMVVNFTDSEDNSGVTMEEQRTTDNKTTGTKEYTIVSGDTLWGLAKKYYGDGSKYTKIYSDNKDVIENAAKAHNRGSSSNGHWIYPGTKINIKEALK